MDPSDDLQAWAPKPSAATAPTISLPGYSDFRLVAHGGEGTVYRASQDGLGRDVAVKVLDVTDPDTLARFRRELEITVRLGRQHPHVVTVLDTGSVAGRPCIVMEYYDLGSLHDRLRERGPLPVADVIAAGIAVADALAFAHGQGILHRDVKPQNILVLPTSYVLADFGIARGADAGHSASLQLVSYRHAAPQMVEGHPPAASDDLWSLGSTLFTLLDGQPPFASSTPEQDTMLGYLGRVRSAAPRSLLRRDVPPELIAIIVKCLAKAREDRFPDAAALRAALAAVPTWTPQAGVDPDHTAAVRREVREQIPEGPTAIPDFGPRPPAEPAPAEPAEVAPEPVRSWTEDLADLTVRHDARPRPVLPPPAPPLVTLPEPPPKHRRNPRALVFSAIAVVSAVAAGALWATQDRGGTTATLPTTTTTAPIVTTGVTTGVTAAEDPGIDPTFAPTLNRLEDNGSSIDVLWTDPTDGQAQFVLMDVTGGKHDPVVTVVAGVTRHTVTGLDPQAREYCYQVLAFSVNGDGKRGASTPACAVRNR
ncbi:protein kinase [Actinosynnema sp. NPDC047251]|uniref:non-specific serine/threonine protein kinase n=1 Tax=Saccharothrix espanaensis (strain ATCC 51144 / DSM 44229 / JCM 9112 / NBRC 15066 / NRRL 15764) TaxID=1179773 RepID=K0JX16_SACES|nr:protein kinase [Saccharothrix espanaensis]CCH30576.1 Serine/threonine protein kinase [Saccharothrix espanaensis DSM 44229]